MRARRALPGIVREPAHRFPGKPYVAQVTGVCPTAARWRADNESRRTPPRPRSMPRPSESRRTPAQQAHSHGRTSSGQARSAPDRCVVSALGCTRTTARQNITQHVTERRRGETSDHVPPPQEPEAHRPSGAEPLVGQACRHLVVGARPVRARTGDDRAHAPRPVTRNIRGQSRSTAPLTRPGSRPPQRRAASRNGAPLPVTVSSPRPAGRRIPPAGYRPGRERQAAARSGIALGKVRDTLGALPEVARDVGHVQ